MQQDSTASIMITELKSQLKEKDYQLEKRDSLIRDQTDRIEELEQKVSELKIDLDAFKSEAIRSCECKLVIASAVPLCIVTLYSSKCIPMGEKMFTFYC